MKNISVLGIFIVALLQVNQSHSLFQYVQSNPAPANTDGQPELDQLSVPGAQNSRHHGIHGTFGTFGLNLAGHLSNPIFKSSRLGGGIQHFYVPPPHFPYIPFGKEFYEECGTAVRRCEWTKQVKAGSRLTKAHHQMQTHAQDTDASSIPQMEFMCITTKYVCVGNTESCISARNCDVAMKISEMEIEVNGKTKTAVSSVSHLNNCTIDGQSVTDDSRMSQMMFAIGFATYDEAGQTLECRSPKASDFKLIFLWKNSSVESSDENNGHCKPNPEHHNTVNHYDVDIMTAARTWSAACKGMEKKDEVFTLKSFLTTHVPTSEYTPYFSPPFNFADNVEPQYSSNKMVISGVVN